MNTNDLENMAHDAYEIHLYEKIRTENPSYTPAMVAMKVIGTLNLGVDQN